MARRRIARRNRAGRLVLALYGSEAAVISVVLRDLVALLVDDAAESEVRARLFPRAYLDPTEEAAEQEWQGLVHDDLVAARRAALLSVIAAADAAASDDDVLVEIEVDAEQETQWLTVLNDARIAIGTVLPVVDDEDPLDYPAGDPRQPMAELYHWLTGLHLALVDVLLEELPKAGLDDGSGGR
jgi:hypothetical protein